MKRNAKVLKYKIISTIIFDLVQMLQGRSQPLSWGGARAENYGKISKKGFARVGGARATSAPPSYGPILCN